jgi:cyanophycinase
MRSIWCLVISLVVSIGGPSFADPIGPVASAFGLATAQDFRDPHFDYFVVGDPAAPRAARTQFGLVLMGGGGRQDEAFQAIAQRAGHGHIVILRAVSDDSFDPTDGDYGESFMKQWGPVTSAQTIVFHDRSASYDPRVLEALGGADGVFLAGGDQSNYLRYWKGTPVERLLNAHVAANRPIGGSSAGLAILGRYSYTAADGGSMESRVALSDPYDSGMTLESEFLHFSGLEHVITDSHFSARSRLGRLIVFLARLRNDTHENIVGLGVDEHTAVLIDRSGTGHLLPGSEGSAWLVRPTRPALSLEKGRPLTMAGVVVQRMDAHGRLDLERRVVFQPAQQIVLSVSAGGVERTSFASAILRRGVVPSDES